ncbi:MAG: 30S ribosomal protein S17 [Deltaproteobacteria bacterium]|nr:30S ribosomal protein S17 [Deltaproteobacteria bacterium]
MTEERKRTMLGRVRSDKMDKTVVVETHRRVRDPRYGKFVQTRVRYKAHDEQNECGVGDLVEIVESRPLSRDKRWVVKRIVEKAVEV